MNQEGAQVAKETKGSILVKWEEEAEELDGQLLSPRRRDWSL